MNARTPVELASAVAPCNDARRPTRMQAMGPQSLDWESGIFPQVQATFYAPTADDTGTPLG